MNPHGFPHTPLKRARIPIPPRRLILFNFQLSRTPPLSQKRYSIVFVRQSATSTYIYVFNKNYIITNIIFVKLFYSLSRGERDKKFADERNSSCNVGEDMSRTEQDTRTGKPPLFVRTTGVKKSLPPTFLFKKFADEGTRTPMSFLART